MALSVFEEANVKPKFDAAVRITIQSRSEVDRLTVCNEKDPSDERLFREPAFATSVASD